TFCLLNSILTAIAIPWGLSTTDFVEHAEPSESSASSPSPNHLPPVGSLGDRYKSLLTDMIYQLDAEIAQLEIGNTFITDSIRHSTPVYHGKAKLLFGKRITRLCLSYTLLAESDFQWTLKWSFDSMLAKEKRYFDGIAKEEKIAVEVEQWVVDCLKRIQYYSNLSGQTAPRIHDAPPPLTSLGDPYKAYLIELIRRAKFELIISFRKVQRCVLGTGVYRESVIDLFAARVQYMGLLYQQVEESGFSAAQVKQFKSGMKRMEEEYPIEEGLKSTNVERERGEYIARTKYYDSLVDPSYENPVTPKATIARGPPISDMRGEAAT
ncbi:hypothetical protein H0H93_003859, partial [Arthromyces matolae]